MGERLILIDGNSLIHRAFHALPPLRNSKGMPTNAVYGFTNMLLKLLDEQKPDYIAVAFDKKGPTFRHEEFDGYKAHRQQTPDELASQFVLVKRVLEAFNIEIFEIEGFEADDVLGTIAKKGEEQGFEVVIVTGDKDALQLISPNINVLLTRKGISEMELFDEKKVLTHYQVTPKQMVDVKGLMGDPSDNIPGVPKVGQKTAIKLIKEFSSIENLMENIDKISGQVLKNNLLVYKDQAFLSKKLATIILDVPIEVDFEKLKTADINQNSVLELFADLEFHSLVKRLKTDTLKKHDDNPNFIMISRTDSTNETSIKELIEKIKKCKRIVLEVEGNLLNPMKTDIIGLAFGLENGETFYVPIKSLEQIKVFKGVLEDDTIKKIGHDLKYSYITLKRNGVELKGIEFDTMIASYLLDPSRSHHQLEDIALEKLNIKLMSREEFLGKGKNAVDIKQKTLEELKNYTCSRVNTIAKLYSVLLNLLNNNDLIKLFTEIEIPLIEPLASMELNGFNIDVDELKRLSKMFGEKLENLTEQIYRLADAEFNINSTKQLGEILFEKLGLPAIKKTKTGYSTSASVLEELRGHHDIIDKILEYRTLMKLKSTYVDGLMAVINPETGKVHSSFNQTITSTGRISSTEPNLQNIPTRLEIGRKIRKVFIPENSNLLVSGDYSQIELRVLAHISGDQNLINAFEKDQDIHTITASEVFNVPVEQVTSTMRNRAKAVNFGIVYGISDFGLARDLNISRKEAAEYIESYFKKYPGVRDYLREVVASAKRNGYVKTILNRRRYLPELYSSNFNLRSFAERTAMNTPIQGSAADIIKIAMIKIYTELKQKGYKTKLLLQIHDELVFDVPKQELEEVSRLIKTNMEGAVTLAVPLKVDMKIGSNWMEMKKVNI
ncbi:MAG: polymerase [Thermosediminibacterales bacterium]|nr:polymerase [Thermosediminibacterales bacterium]MDK2835274.1 polymerase [Thermosediminibacterales bacterium]